MEIIALDLNWQTTLFKIDSGLLIVESAWHGSKGAWTGKIAKLSDDLICLIEKCKLNQITTVFWNKEDPVHLHRFLLAASYFDYIFTTDISSLPLYKNILGHSNIYLLPFAAELKLNNPLENINRQNSAAYAGSFYHRFSQRSKDLKTIFDAVMSICDVHIYDRYKNSIDINYRFPNNYEPFIVGSLPPDKIDIAYKGHTYGINLNTVKTSESMFSRRVFELLGSGTVTISNESTGIRYLFGDLVITSDNCLQIRRRLQELVDNPILRYKVALAGVRKVMLEHTYSHRLDRIRSIVFGVPQKKHSLPSLCVVAKVCSVAELIRIQQMLIVQEQVDWRALIMIDDRVDLALIKQQTLPDERINYMTEDIATKQILAALLEDEEWVAGWHVEDYYGPNYLLDLILGTLYSDALVLGKAAFFCVSSYGPALLNQKAVYRPMEQVRARCAVLSAKRLFVITVSEWLDLVVSGNVLPDAMANGALSLDALSYCQDAWRLGWTYSNVSALVDLLEIDTGHNIDDLYAKADAIPVHIPSWLGKSSWRLENLAQTFGICDEASPLHCKLDKFGLHLVSEIPDGNHSFIWAVNAVSIVELGGQNALKFHVVEGPGLSINLMVKFETERGGLVSEEMFETNQNQEWHVPSGATNVRLGFRVYSSGTTRIMRFMLCWL